MKTLKVYLDDVRDTPKGWTRTYTVADTIELLRSGTVGELSLDHDLGMTDPNFTGYDVLLWIEHQVYMNRNKRCVPEAIFLHTDNPIGKQRMQAAVESILKKMRTL